MDKYTLLFVLNLPFIIFGLIKSVAMYKRGSTQRVGLALRLIFWMAILLSLFFAQDIYNYLLGHRLTDTSPLSLADVVLTTGIIFCLFLCTRLYSKLDATEKRLSALQEKLSIQLSKPKI